MSPEYLIVGLVLMAGLLVLLARRRPIRMATFLAPSVWLFVPIVASAVAWWFPIPFKVFRGFERRSELTASGLFVLLLWMFGLGLVTFVATRLASGRSRHREYDYWWRARQLESVLMAFSIVGTAIAVYYVLTSVNAVAALTSGRGNQIAEAIPYSAGPQTLRYSVGPAAGLSLALAIQHRKMRLATVINVVCLLVVATASARVQIVISGIVCTVLVSSWHPGRRLSGRGILIAGLVFLGVLTPFSYWRTASHYRELGIENPVGVSTSQIVTYLGAPFQAQVHVAKQVVEGSEAIRFGTDVDGLTGLFVPGFLNEVRDPRAGFDDTRYGPGLDLRRSLTTNSALADLSAFYGYMSSWLAVAVVGVASFLMVRLLSRGDIGADMLGALLAYGLSEFWRIYAFNLGHFLFDIFLVVGAIVVVRVFMPGPPIGPAATSSAARQPSDVPGLVGSSRISRQQHRR